MAKGDFAAARNAWLPPALRGDVDAQFNLGALYDNGLGVPRDAAKAAQWYRHAAGRKLALAQVALARMKRAGEIEQVDWEETVGMLAAAAERGSAEAQYELAVTYDRGIGAEGVIRQRP